MCLVVTFHFLSLSLFCSCSMHSSCFCLYSLAIVCFVLVSPAFLICSLPSLLLFCPCWLPVSYVILVCTWFSFSALELLSFCCQLFLPVFCDLRFGYMDYSFSSLESESVILTNPSASVLSAFAIWTLVFVCHTLTQCTDVFLSQT